MSSQTKQLRYPRVGYLNLKGNSILSHVRDLMSNTLLPVDLPRPRTVSVLMRELHQLAPLLQSARSSSSRILLNPFTTEARFYVLNQHMKTGFSGERVKVTFQN